MRQSSCAKSPYAQLWIWRFGSPVCTYALKGAPEKKSSSVVVLSTLAGLAGSAVLPPRKVILPRALPKAPPSTLLR